MKIKKRFGSLILSISRIKNPIIKSILIFTFKYFYKIDLSEYKKKNIGDFKHFNDFFTRELSEGERNIITNSSHILSPVDGKIIEYGRVNDESLIQVKNSTYNLSELLNFNSVKTETYRNGSYIALYLAPYNYHRVHMPLDGELEENSIIPGELHPVNDKALKMIPDLYSRNQRMLSYFKNSYFEFLIVMVAALNVADINKKWSNEDLSSQSVSLKQGEEYSSFNLGSTVLLLFQKECTIKWSDDLNRNENIQLGQVLATLVNN